MGSLITWPVEWLARQFGGRRARALQAALGDARFVDATEWARLNRISREEAQDELERGVRSGYLERMFLYEGADSPVTFVVPEARLDTLIQLSEIGDFSEEEDRQLVVSRFRSRAVYVASTK
jgi:hypothetical protein